MLIDSHIHIARRELISEDIASFLEQKGVWGEIEKMISPDGVVGALDQASVEKAVIFPLSFMPPDGIWQKLNEMTAEYIQLHPQRLIGFGIINPLDMGESLKEAERCVNDYNFLGFKVHPTMQKFYPNREDFSEFYAFCSDKRLPILFHTGASLSNYADKYSHPSFLDEVAVRHPELKIIMAHMGRPYYQDAALLLRKHKNVYADICANEGRTGDPKLLEMVFSWLKIYANGVEKLLFASDYPIFRPEKMHKYLEMLHVGKLIEGTDIPLVSDDEFESILHGNILKILELNLNTETSEE